MCARRGYRSASEPGEPERREIESRHAIRDEIREDLADGGCELEAVSGAWARDGDSRVRGDAIDDEVAVRRVRVQAHRLIAERAQPGQPLSRDLLHRCALLLVHDAADRVARRDLSAMMLGDLHTV